MADGASYSYDAAVALAQGCRDRQEDAVVTHFPEGSGLGCIVLADGMGGHAAGDMASSIVVQEVLAELRAHAGDPSHLEQDIGAILRAALDRANLQVARQTDDRPELRGMGSTVVAPLVVGNRLYWISVGDSPLYLMRGPRMARLNQEHSMARRVEALVALGKMSRAEADHHPDRDCLTSVLIGATIPEIDCRDCPLTLQDGDILITASDGLQFLDETCIATLVHDNRHLASTEIAMRLLQEIREVDDPDQDNVSLCVLKIREEIPASQTAAVMTPARPPAIMSRTFVQLHARRHDQQVSCRISSLREG